MYPTVIIISVTEFTAITLRSFEGKVIKINWTLGCFSLQPNAILKVYKVSVIR